MFHHPSNIIWRIQTRTEKVNSVDPDEVAHYEPPHLDLHCFQIQLFSFLMLFIVKPYIVFQDKCLSFTLKNKKEHVTYHEKGLSIGSVQLRTRTD